MRKGRAQQVTKVSTLVFIWESLNLLAWKYVVTFCLLSAKLQDPRSQFGSCIIHIFLNPITVRKAYFGHK